MGPAALRPWRPVAAAPCTWQAGAEMPVKRSETPAIVHKGMIYIAGGFEADKRVDRYDPDTDTWSRLADLPFAINHPGIAVWQDRVIVAGGYSGDASSAFQDIWMHDAVDDEWSRIGLLPYAMGAFGLATIDEDLYVVGGALDHLGGEAVGTTWRMSPDTTEWSECAPMEHPREHLVVISHRDQIYAVGGRAHGSDSDLLGESVERYDPGLDKWERLAPLPHPRSGLAGTAVPGGIVVSGGETSTSVFSNVQFLGDSATSWKEMPPLPIPVHGAALVHQSHFLFAIGGSTKAGAVAGVRTTHRLELTCALQ